MNNYEKIKNMTIDEMAKFLTELQCAECGYGNMNFDIGKCNLTGCWCHPTNGYQSYGNMLRREVEDE